LGRGKQKQKHCFTFNRDCRGTKKKKSLREKGFNWGGAKKKPITDWGGPRKTRENHPSGQNDPHQDAKGPTISKPLIDHGRKEPHRKKRGRSNLK